ncbi:MAG: hypothetical protein NTV01_21620 [Bacteroidia bacterium]|nr:hypothetical protein [Bacteroidia bacterium]
MNSKLYFRIVSLTGAMILIACLTGCRDMFKDPLIDKKTGDKVNVFIMDRNFITTKLDIRLMDMLTLQPIDQESIEVRFMGPDAANIITFTGDKLPSHTTSNGFLEVGYDPNIAINSANPLELTIVAISSKYISAPQFVSYTVEGIKNVPIKMIRIIEGKSMTFGAFGEPYDLKYNGALNSSQLHFISDISSLPTGIAYDYINLYSTLANGTLVCDNLKDNVLYSDYGVYYLGSSSLVPPALPTKNAGLQSGDYVYSTVLKSGMLKCDQGQGLTINVDRADGETGTGLFDYLITFSDGTTMSGQVTCTFPSSTLIEPVYYPGSNPAIKVELFGDAQYNISAAVNLQAPCNAAADFVATPRSNLKTYKFVTQYSCPDSNVGMGLTIVGEFRKSGSSDPWTTFEFKEGICELLMVPDTDYEFRVNIDAKYYNYTVPTDPAKVEEFLIDKQLDDYRLKSLSISSDDTLVTIMVDVEFSQGICDAIR